MSFPSYNEYARTEYDWLPELPAHWSLKQLRYLLLPGSDGIKIGPFGSQLTASVLVDQGYKVYGQENVIGNDFDKGRRFVSDEKYQSLSVYKIQPGDLLVTMMGSAGRCKSVPSGVAPGVMDSHLLRIRFSKEVNGRFAELLLDSAPYISFQTKLLGKGSIMHGLNSSVIKQLVLAVPPLKEQKNILAFLDHETAKIDALIAEQQRLIELLKEKRQTVISHAVTKGLDPDVPMKDSGVEWLGEVPAHWEVMPAKRLYEFVTSGSRGWAEYYSDEGQIFFRIGNLSRESINPKLDSIQYVRPPTEGEGQRARIKVGDILTSITADLGSVCAACDKIVGGYVSQHIALARPNSRVKSSRWLAYFVLSAGAKSQLLESGYGGTKVQLSLEDIKELIVSVPPPSEQFAIAELLDTRIKRIDELVESAYQGNEFLRERRSALISAAVTGKIDVRNWQSSRQVEKANHPKAAEEAAFYE